MLSFKDNSKLFTMRNIFLLPILLVLFLPFGFSFSPSDVLQGEVLGISEALAQGAPNMGNFVTCEGNKCGTCELVRMGKNILNWLIGMLLVIFSIIVAYSGFKLVISGGNTSARSEAKSMITSAFVGLVIVLAAWLIVDTLMRALLPGGGNTLGERNLPWSTIECTKQVVTTPPKPVASMVMTSGVPSSCEVTNIAGDQTIYDCDDSLDPSQLPRGCVKTDKWMQAVRDETWTCPDVEPPPYPGTLSEGGVLAKFNANGITFSSTGNNCTDKNRRNCTGLDGLQEVTVENIIDLKKNCRCSINVSGGTEIGHAENDGRDHSSGYKYDVSLNPQLEEYIKSIDGVVVGKRGGDTTYTAPDGTVYAKESDHWDIQVN